MVIKQKSLFSKATVVTRNYVCGCVRGLDFSADKVGIPFADHCGKHAMHKQMFGGAYLIPRNIRRVERYL